jgi:hypothetical protein
LGWRLLGLGRPSLLDGKDDPIHARDEFAGRRRVGIEGWIGHATRVLRGGLEKGALICDLAQRVLGRTGFGVGDVCPVAPSGPWVVRMVQRQFKEGIHPPFGHGLGLWPTEVERSTKP